jgi:hypothetical protein
VRRVLRLPSREARDKAGKGDNAAIRGHTDMSGVDSGLEFEFVEHVTPKLVDR